ncbi:MAG TPA: ATP-binding cassette domain-containing protein [Phycisphaerales bacterium]|nr:ATP-binding cassette domain-containing protein [Phycisphaerales bacterium]
MSLRLESIHVTMGSGRSSRRVLSGLDADFAPGLVTAIVGPNGAGKSTLVRTSLGFIEPRSGRVTLDGVPVGSFAGERRAQHLVYIPQHSTVAFAYRVRDVVAMGLVAAGRGFHDDPDTRIGRSLLMVELADRAMDAFGELSAGQRQRATLARALAQVEAAVIARRDGGRAAMGCEETIALLADEPVSAMDPRQALATLGLLRSLSRQGVAVAVVLHDLTLAAGVADRVLLLGTDGTIVAHGPTDDVLVPEVLAPALGLGMARVSTPGGGWLIGPNAPPACRQEGTPIPNG